MAEFHNLSERHLNRPGEAWGNLGYWKNADTYSNACRDLALLLGDTIGLDEQSTMIDAGFGCGDQLLLWLKHYKVCEVSGVNYSRSQTALAQQRLIEAGFENAANAIHYGNVDSQNIWRDLSKSVAINRVVALDSIYHFPSRERFFQASAERLQPNGRLAVTDFLLDITDNLSSSDQFILSWMLKLSHIPAANIVTQGEYIRQTETAGFKQIDIQDISKYVLPSFGMWLREHKEYQGMLRVILFWHEWIKYDVTARFLDWAYRRRILRYCLISAVKS